MKQKDVLKLIGATALTLVLFFLSGCDLHRNDDPRVFFYDEPSVVEGTFGNNFLLRTTQGYFLIPISNDTPDSGDIITPPQGPLWSYFEVDLNSPKTPVSTTHVEQDLYSVTGFHCQAIDSSKVLMPADTTAFDSIMTDDHDGNIRLATLHKETLDYLLFFGFEHDSDPGRYDYEIVKVPETGRPYDNPYPNFYIRAKKWTTEQTSRPQIHNQTIYAFDMTKFVMKELSTATTGNNYFTLHFNLHYKVGEKDGKDIYRPFRSNPISWTIPNREFCKTAGTINQ